MTYDQLEGITTGHRKRNPRSAGLDPAERALRTRTPRLNMGVAVLRQRDDDVSVARFTLHAHQLAKLDRFLAQARRHATRSGAEFDGVAVEIDPAGVVSVRAAGLIPLML